MTSMKDREEFLGGQASQALERMGDVEFDEWMGQVDELCVAATGFSVHDFADATWRDYFNDGLSPAAGLETAVEDGLLI